MKRKHSRKNLALTVFLALILLSGLALILYPTVSDLWNSRHQSLAIASYVETVDALDEETYTGLWSAAKAYNAALPRDDSRFEPDESSQELYNSLLDVSGSGIMGYVEIPSLGVSLPIYHGTDEEVLQVAVGHIQGSSLPVGGDGTHCVISGHRGLPSATLFTDLDQLSEGDVFSLHVLGETLTYEVDQIHIVEPDDISHLGIEEGKDLCTLITCTPYGVNSHRLLVRGHRVEAGDAPVSSITADAARINPNLVAAVMAMPVLLVLVLFVLFRPSRKRKYSCQEVRKDESE